MPTMHIRDILALEAPPRMQRLRNRDIQIFSNTDLIDCFADGFEEQEYPSDERSCREG